MRYMGTTVLRRGGREGHVQNKRAWEGVSGKGLVFFLGGVEETYVKTLLNARLTGGLGNPEFLLCGSRRPLKSETTE